MNASQLDRRITIERKEITPDPDYGTPVESWVGFATRWAQVQDVLPSKSERVAEGLRVATRPARIRLRYMAGITSDMRVIVHGATDRLMQIVGGPAELGRREWTELVCEEYTSV